MPRTLRSGFIGTAAIMLAVGASGAFAAPQPSCQQLSANLLKSLQGGHFKAATAGFNGKMASALGPEKMQELWQQTLPQQFGAFKHVATPKSVQRGSLNVVVTPLKFERAWLDWIVSCNGKGKIDGLHFRPGAAPAPATTQAATSATAWITQAAVGTKTLPITVQRDGFALKGLLDLPSGKGPFGVVDLIPGSGPVTINGDGHDSHGGISYSPYKKLAAALVKAGWAVVRVAKRGMPPSTGKGNHMIFSDQVADNLAIVKALRKNPHINPRRIVAAGHSLGGLIAPRLATEIRLAGLILLEAPGENMKKILNAQAIQMAQYAGDSATQIAAVKQDQKHAYKELQRAKPGQAVTIQFSKGAKTFPASQVALFKSWFAENVLATASKVETPVLVVQGGMDFNVPPCNGKRLVKAIPNAKLLYLPKMGHALDIAHCRCVKQLQTGKDAELAPGLATGIVHWLHALQ